MVDDFVKMTGKSEADAIAELTRGVPMKRVAEVDEVVEVILFAADPKNSFMTGHALAVDGGIARSRLSSAGATAAAVGRGFRRQAALASVDDRSANRRYQPDQQRTVRLEFREPAEFDPAQRGGKRDLPEIDRRSCSLGQPVGDPASLDMVVGCDKFLDLAVAHRRVAIRLRAPLGLVADPMPASPMPCASA